MEENIWELAKNVIELDECKQKKNESIHNQKYEHAAAYRDQEKFLMTDEGKKWSTEEKRKIRIQQREQKLKRLDII